jgi:predicted CXXCH cytochrome family protein
MVSQTMKPAYAMHRSRRCERLASIGIVGLMLLMLVGLLALPAAVHGQTQIALTKHNLTASGPGPVRTTDASTGLCVFCHTPHSANPTRALWNRALPGVSYQLYTSSTLKAQLNQPTGSSRLCLSCHDGVLALGNLRVPPKGSNIVLGALTGSTVLGTNLSSDHPISFVYDNALALSRGELANPLTLPSKVRLDDTNQIQCTTCHDPHENRQPNFLRMDNRFGAMCTSCHRTNHWSDSSHATSTAKWNGAGTNPWSSSAFATVAENACLNCHRPHAAARPQWLLAQSAEPANCTVCHNANVATKNVEQEFAKPFRHDISASQWVHDPNENPLLMPRHVACADCHNAHAATATPGVPPAVSGALRGVKGVTISGSVIAEASSEYEVCSKCHGMAEPTTTGITRQSGTRNVRLKINPANASFHPIAAPGKNPATLGLQPGYSTSSIIGCTDCHNNDDWTPTGTSPRGPHGSRYEPILGAQYLTNDPTPESYQNYALCYQCHNESFLVNDQAATFPHNKHLVPTLLPGGATPPPPAPCAACHDAHGSRQGAHLVDFMLRDRTGKLVVSPSAVQGRLEYTPLGPGHGQCYLQCHGVNHEPKSY